MPFDGAVFYERWWWYWSYLCRCHGQGSSLLYSWVGSGLDAEPGGAHKLCSERRWVRSNWHMTYHKLQGSKKWTRRDQVKIKPTFCLGFTWHSKPIEHLKSPHQDLKPGPRRWGSRWLSRQHCSHNHFCFYSCASYYLIPNFCLVFVISAVYKWSLLILLTS